MRDAVTRPKRQKRQESRAQSIARIRVVETADRRAERRFAYVRVVRAAEGSLADARRVLLAAIQTGRYTFEDGTAIHVPPPVLEPGQAYADAVPSREQVGRWRRWTPEQVTLANCYDKRRPGRPREALHPKLTKVVRKAVEQPGGATAAEAYEAVRNAAKLLVLAGAIKREPGRHVARRAFREISAVHRAAAQNGKRAAIADAMAKAALPYDRPFECFVLDETTLPVYVRVWLPTERQYIALKLPVCLVIDAASEVIVGYWIANPVTRGVRRGMDGIEIFAAFCAAVFPALATPACVDYVGHLPGILRFDNIGAHAEVRKRAGRIGINISNSPVYSPWSNGLIEKVNQIVKPLCKDIKGFDEKWAIAEYETDDPYQRRKQLAATLNRLPTHVNILIEQLHDVQQFRKEFDEKVVQPYNREREHSRWKTTRDGQFHEMVRREECRSWLEGVGMLDVGRTVVDDAVLFRGARFAPKTALGHRFENGEHVEFRADPMLRALWVEETPGLWTALPPIKEWARNQVPGELVREAHRVAQRSSDLARESRFQYQADMLGGEDQAALANAVAEMRLGESAKQSPKAGSKRSQGGGRKSAGAKESASGASAGGTGSGKRRAPADVDPLRGDPRPAAAAAPASAPPGATAPAAAAPLGGPGAQAPVPPPPFSVVPGDALPRGIARRPTARLTLLPGGAPAAPTPATAPSTGSSTRTSTSAVPPRPRAAGESAS